MSTAAARPKKRPTARLPSWRFKTLQDVLDYLGGIPAKRVCMQPWPGKATQRDLLRRSDRGRCELFDGILVERAVGYHESLLASVLSGFIFSYLLDNNIGAVNSGGDGYLKLKRRRIFVPDVSFVRWDNMPERRTPTEACPELVADLVVEVISRGNTKKEIERKREAFFERGTRLFWVVHPRKQTVTVYHSVDDGVELDLADYVDGENVLPGFRLSIRKWFELAERGNSPSGKPKRA